MSADEARRSPPTEAEAARNGVAKRARTGEKLDIAGGATRARLGTTGGGRARGSPPPAWQASCSTSRRRWTLCAKAGAPLSASKRRSPQHGQMLPFEPMDHRALYGGDGEPTVGGLVASNVSGPRRISAGAARDSLIGVRLVNGRGEIVKSGGRVMKNVTGLDLVKLNCGAHGTLGLVLEATFKLLPRPRSRGDDRHPPPRGRAGARGDVARARLALRRQRRGAIRAGMGREFPRTFLRLEGFAISVDYRSARLSRCSPIRRQARAGRRGFQSLWRAIRDAEFLIAAARARGLARQHRAVEGAEFVARLGAARSRISTTGAAASSG